MDCKEIWNYDSQSQLDHFNLFFGHLESIQDKDSRYPNPSRRLSYSRFLVLRSSIKSRNEKLLTENNRPVIPTLVSCWQWKISLESVQDKDSSSPNLSKIDSSHKTEMVPLSLVALSIGYKQQISDMRQGNAALLRCFSSEFRKVE